MSHVVSVKKIVDLDALLDVAAPKCGCHATRGRTTYRWWGSYVGDYPLPAGYTAADLGKCDHVITVVDGYPGSFEVGVVVRKDGAGYDLLFDFFGHKGRELEAKIGHRAEKLIREYEAEVARKRLSASGYIVSRYDNADTGEIKLTCTQY